MKLNEIIEFKSSPLIIERLNEFGFTKIFKEGEVILNENVYIKAIPIVTNGSVRVMRNDEEGREILLYYIKSGESCVTSFLGGLHHDTSKVKVIAEEETQILFIPIDKVGLFIKEFPELFKIAYPVYHYILGLKDKIAKVIVMVLVVSFFQRVLHAEYKGALEMLYFAVSITALSLGLYLLHKGGKH